VISGAFVQQVDKDRWNNVKLSQPKPGQFFNRRNCSWYWNSKRKDATLLQGLIAFAKEDYETAEKYWNLLAELDKEFYAQQKASGWENATTLARLTWNLRNQKGSLYATPEEMASFKNPKRRLAILVADLYYGSEQHQKALSIYQRLEENRELGTLSKNELAYIMFGIFSCLAWYPNIDEITYLSPRIKLILGTPSESRTILGYSNRLTQKNNIEAYLRSLKVLEYYILKYPDSEEMETICFFYIDRCKLLVDTFRLSEYHNIKLADELYERLLKICKKYLGNNNMNLYRSNIESIFSSTALSNFFYFFVPGIFVFLCYGII
jgi:hypothetical protein